MQITIDLRSAEHDKLNIALDCSLNGHRLKLQALTIGNGIQISNLAICDPDGTPLPYSIQGEIIECSADRVHIEYTLTTSYKVCVGSDKQQDFIYPFINANEVFFGTGSIPVLETVDNPIFDVPTTLILINLRVGWKVFSNLELGSANESLSGSFFVYAANYMMISTFDLLHTDAVFEILAQYEATLPKPPNELSAFIDESIGWLESQLIPLPLKRHVRLLILQAPTNFEEIANQRSFATGENVPDGIICYAPRNPDYLRRFFDYDDYGYFLLDGIVHEMMHWYTTSSSDGRHKSILFPSAICPSADANLLGETLNSYFHNQYLIQHQYNDLSLFLERHILRGLQNQRPGRKPLLDLFLLDIYLMSQGQSLWTLFRELLRDKQHNVTGYDSIMYLVEIAQKVLQINLPAEYQQMLTGEMIPDYQSRVAEMLRQIGYQIKTERETLIIEPIVGQALPFGLPL
jgi:hypothetical protein